MVRRCLPKDHCCTRICSHRECVAALAIPCAHRQALLVHTWSSCPGQIGHLGRHTVLYAEMNTSRGYLVLKVVLTAHI